MSNRGDKIDAYASTFSFNVLLPHSINTGEPVIATRLAISATPVRHSLKFQLRASFHRPLNKQMPRAYAITRPKSPLKLIFMGA